MMPEPVLLVQGLYKSFGKIKAVNGLSFSVNKGEIFGLLGPNGSGKTTTIRILLSLVRKDAGMIRIFSENIGIQNSEYRKKIGALVERPDFYNYLSAYKNLEILARISGKKILRDSILDKLAWVGLSEFADQKVRIFSHGMKQRLGIAQALINDPELLILDEPANGLDPHGVVDIRNIILRLSKEQGITIILSSHILKEVELVANRMVVIHHGKALTEGKIKELSLAENSPLKISVNDMALATRVLNHLGINEIKISDLGEMIVYTGGLGPASINSALVKGGVEISALTQAQSLEEYFLQITG